MYLAEFFNKNNTNDLENRLITIDNNVLNIYIPVHVDPFIAPLKLPFSTETLIESRSLNSICHYRIVFPNEVPTIFVDINSVQNFNHRFNFIDKTEKGVVYLYNECLTLLLQTGKNIQQIIPNKYNIRLSNNAIKKLHINKLIS